MKNRAFMSLLMMSLVLSGMSTSSRADNLTGDEGGDMVLDLIVARPVGLVATIVGGAVFVLGLPFTIPSGSVQESACALVERPAAYTFMRPLGELGECAGGGCKPCDARSSH